MGAAGRTRLVAKPGGLTLGQLSLASLRGRLIEYSFGWVKGGNVTSAGWQVTLCDPMWHVSSRSSVATLRTAIHLLLTYLLTYLRWTLPCMRFCLSACPLANLGSYRTSKLH